MTKQSNDSPDQEIQKSQAQTQAYEPKKPMDDTSLDQFNSTTDVEYSGESDGGGELLDLSSDFELIEELGRGGMGVVNKCRQKSLDRIVAVKSILSSSFPDENQIASFLDEARAVAKLQHENIVSIHLVSQSVSNPFFVMEYVEGKSLDQLIKTWTLDQHRAVRIMIQITKAVQEAHHNRIVHRDLKPANVLVDANDRVRVTDFGLAEFLNDDQSNEEVGQIVGTPSFMAPEQAKGSVQIDERTDIYAIGATLYACLTGNSPFRAGNVREVLSMVQESDPTPPSESNPKVIRDLETICLKCLEKNPRHRYQTTEELIAEFERVLRNEPIKARPISSAQRLYRTMRRKPLQSTLIVSTVVLLLVVMTMIPFLIVSNLKQQARFQLLNDLRENISKGEWVAGLASVDQLLQQDPDNPEYLFSKLRCWNALGQRQLIVEELERLDQDAPELIDDTQLLLWRGDLVLSGNDVDQGVEYLNRVLGNDVLSKADVCYAKALLAEDVDEVESQLRLAINHDPSHHRAITFLFSTLLMSDEIEKASFFIDLSIAKFPNDPNFLAMKLVVQSKQGKTSANKRLKEKAIALGGESLAPALDFLEKEYSAQSNDLMDHWESADTQNQFKRLLGYSDLPLKIKSKEPSSEDSWMFAPSFLRLPLGQRKRQEKLEASIRLIFFNQHKLAADQMASQVDEKTTGEVLFMIGQAYTVAEEYIKAARYFEMACERPSRFDNLAREANWCAAMNYATLWVADKEKMGLIKSSNRFARRHLEYPPVHAWHEITLGKIACNDGDFVTAKSYLDRMKNKWPDAKEIPDFEKRVYSVAPVEILIEQLSTENDQDDAELKKEIESFQSQLDEIRKKIQEAKEKREKAK